MSPDVTILYDNIRWEEKALLEAGKKNNINIQMVDCKKLALNLEKKPDDYGVVIQRCVSYYRNLHSTAALEGLGIKVINCLNTGVFAGNKLFTHMLLKKFGVPTPDATVAFSKDAAGYLKHASLNEDALQHIHTLDDFKTASTRALSAEDYAYAIKRIREIKPVIVYAKGTIASGSYYASI